MSTPLWFPETIAVACLKPYLDVIVPLSKGFTKLTLFLIYVTSSSLSLELVVSSPPPTPASPILPLSPFCPLLPLFTLFSPFSLLPLFPLFPFC